MKLMEKEEVDVQLLSHFDMVFKPILTDNAMKLMENLPDPTSYNVRVVFINNFVSKPPKPQ